MHRKNKHIVSIEGIVIKQKSFGEGSRLITLIEKERGKMELSAFGSSKEKSRRRDALLSGNLISAVCYQKPTADTLSVREAKTVCSYPNIKSDLSKIAFFYLISEVLDILLAKEAPFMRYPIFTTVLDKMEIFARPAKYALSFLIPVMQDEGIFPHYSPDLPLSIQRATGENFTIETGCSRFIKVSQEKDNLDFWDSKELTVSTMQNLIYLISSIIKYNFDRDLNSIALIKIRQ
jgi:hypothetical protein